MKKTQLIICAISIGIIYLNLNFYENKQNETVFVKIQKDSTELIIPKNNEYSFNCINDKSSKEESVEASVSKINIIPFQKFTVNNNNDTSICLSTGTKIFIPKNAFIDKDSTLVQGEIQIAFREFHSPASIAISGIPMKIDEKKMLISGGMFEMKGFKNKNDIYIRPNYTLNINLASNEKDKRFNHYYFNRKINSWKDLGDLKFDTASITDIITPEIRWWEFTEDFQKKTGYFKSQRALVTLAVREHELRKIKNWKKNPTSDSKGTFYTMFSIKSFPQNAKFRYLSWHLSKKNDKKSIEQFYNLHKEKNQAGHSFWKNMTFEKCENKEYQVYFTNEDSNLVLTVIPDKKNYPGYNKFRNRLLKWEVKISQKHESEWNKLYKEANKNIQNITKNMNQEELERFLRLNAIRINEIDHLIKLRKFNLQPPKTPYKAEMKIRSFGIHNIDAPIDFIVYQSGNILSSPVWALKAGFNAYARATKKKYIKKRRMGYARIIDEPKNNETIDKITLIQKGFNTSIEYTNNQLGKFEYSTHFENLGIVFLQNGTFKIIPPKEFKKYDLNSTQFNFKTITASSSEELKNIIKNLGFEI